MTFLPQYFHQILSILTTVISKLKRVSFSYLEVIKLKNGASMIPNKIVSLPFCFSIWPHVLSCDHCDHSTAAVKRGEFFASSDIFMNADHIHATNFWVFGNFYEKWIYSQTVSFNKANKANTTSKAKKLSILYLVYFQTFRWFTWIIRYKKTYWFAL